MKKFLTLALTLTLATAAFGLDPNEIIVTTNTYIDISGKIIYCSYKDLPSGVYYAKSENGIYKFIKLR